MARVQLTLYRDPGAAEVFLNIRRRDGIDELLAATIDTGAAVSLLPASFLTILDHQPTQRGSITIEQAGIANQTFDAIEAITSVSLVDQYGESTPEFKARFWFAETEARLVGFADILDQAVLHLDMKQLAGWLEIES